MSTDFLRFCSIAAALFLLAVVSGARAADDDWPDDSVQALEVNEGELVFIDPAPGENILYAETELRLDADSPGSGWVDMRQCYRQLDRISKTEITFAYREMTALRVTSSENIGAIDAGEQSLLLSEVGRGASVCVAARVRILRNLANGKFQLQNGPYHRRFFDGYYPYHVRLNLRFARSGLELVAIDPPAQPGFSVETTADDVLIEAWFEGILTITAEFGLAAR